MECIHIGIQLLSLRMFSELSVLYRESHTHSFYGPQILRCIDTCFIYLLVHGRWCCFSFLAVTNYAAVYGHLSTHFCLDVCFHSLGYTPKSGVVGSCGNSVFKF